MTGTNFSSWYNPAEGTFYAEAAPAVSDFGANKSVFNVSDGTAANYAGIRYQSSGSQPALGVGVNSVLQANCVTGAMVAGTYFKVAGTYALNNFVSARDGAAGTTDNVGTVPNVTMAEIGTLGVGSFIATQAIKKLAYYPKRLSSAQMQSLTK
jgi:hypothetical protein